MLNVFTKFRRSLKTTKLKNRKGKRSISSFSPKRDSSSKKKGKGKGIQNLLQLAIILTMCVFMIGWLGYSIFKFITADFKLAYKDTEPEQVDNWRGEGRMNLLLVGLDKREGEYGFVDAVSLVMLDPSENSIGIFNIHPDTKVYLSNVNRYIKLRNLYNYGILDADEIPIELFIETVEDLVSIKINKYVILDEEGLIEISEALGGIYINNKGFIEDKDIKTSSGRYELSEGNIRLKGNDFLYFIQADDDSMNNKFQRQNDGLEGLLKRLSSYMIVIKGPILLDALKENINTNLTKNEMIRILYEISKFREVRSAYMNESTMEVVDTGSDISYYPIYDYLDQEIQRVFIDNTVGKEQARVEIFNSTSIKGLAAFRSRWLRNIGIDVIRVGDCPRDFEKTTVFTRGGEKYDNTIEAIKKSFDEEIIVKEGELPNWVCTGDVVVVLGSNINDD